LCRCDAAFLVWETNIAYEEGLTIVGFIGLVLFVVTAGAPAGGPACPVATLVAEVAANEALLAD
jgi:hypothetical protein